LPSGAENEYYLSLNPPRQCKNSALDCIEELSLVKGFNDPKIIESLKYSSTVTSNGKININTAPVEALMTLPQIDYGLAQAIVAYRNGKDLLPGTADDLPFDNISKLQAVVGSNVYNAVQNMITVKSSHFKVTLKTNMGKYCKIVEALLYRKGKNIQTKYWKEL
jgi:type II secretory pathway component PulK